MARRKNTRNIPKRVLKKIYSIIVDGKTETWYFQMLRKNENLSQINIKPELPKNKKLKELYELVTEHAQIYDKVIWILDFDVIVKEEKERKKGQASVIKIFQEYVKKLEKDCKNVVVLVNNPCLEFWYLLHFEPTGKFYSNCDDAIRQLRKHLPDYEKTEKYYKKNNNDIYKRLKPLQNIAKSNAKRLANFDFENPQKAKAEIYKILDILEIQE